MKITILMITAFCAWCVLGAEYTWTGGGIAPWKELFATFSRRKLSPWFSIELFNPSYWRTGPADTLRTGMEKLRELESRING